MSDEREQVYPPFFYFAHLDEGYRNDLIVGCLSDGSFGAFGSLR